MPTELADGVVQLTPLRYLNCFAVRGGNGWTLVDTGAPQTASRLVAELGRAGIGRGDVERVVLTHGHFDHAGGVARVQEAFGVREVLVSDTDLPAVRRGANASGVPGSLVSRFPEFVQPGYRAVPDAVPAPPSLALDDGRTLAIVPTPGHTDGHVALHLVEDGVLLGGDTVFNVWSLTPAPGFLCSDAGRNLASILALSELAPTTMGLAHGDALRGDVAGELRTLAHA